MQENPPDWLFVVKPGQAWFTYVFVIAVSWQSTKFKGEWNEKRMS